VKTYGEGVVVESEDVVLGAESDTLNDDLLVGGGDGDVVLHEALGEGSAEVDQHGPLYSLHNDLYTGADGEEGDEGVGEDVESNGGVGLGASGVGATNDGDASSLDAGEDNRSVGGDGSGKGCSGELGVHDLGRSGADGVRAVSDADGVALCGDEDSGGVASKDQSHSLLCQETVEDSESGVADWGLAVGIDTRDESDGLSL